MLQQSSMLRQEIYKSEVLKYLIISLYLMDIQLNMAYCLPINNQPPFPCIWTVAIEICRWIVWKKHTSDLLPMCASTFTVILQAQSLSPQMVCFISKSHFDAQSCEGYSPSLQDGLFSMQRDWCRFPWPLQSARTCNHSDICTPVSRLYRAGFRMRQYLPRIQALTAYRKA